MTDSPSLPRRTWLLLKDLGIYLAALFALIIFVDYQKDEALKQFRAEINGAYTSLCVRNQANPFLNKYDLLIDTLIEDLQKRRQENILKGDFIKAGINADTITDLSKARVPVVRVDCRQPLLPGR